MSSKGSGITLTNNEIKNITKVTKSLENGGDLWKGTSRKIPVKKEDIWAFLVQ